MRTQQQPAGPLLPLLSSSSSSPAESMCPRRKCFVSCVSGPPEFTTQSPPAPSDEKLSS